MARTPGRNILRKSAVAFATGSGALLLALLLGRVGVVRDLLQDYEMKTLDYRVARYRGSLQAPGTSPSGVVIVDVDEKSLAELGQFQRWPRYFHAQILERLTEARGVGFDILFSEPDGFPTDVADHYARELAGTLGEEEGRVRGLLLEVGGDEAFARGILAEGGVVLGIGAHLDGDSLLFEPPVPALGGAAAGLGHVQLLPDRDGVIRRIPGALLNGDSLVLALGVRLFLQERGLPASGARLLPGGGLEGEGWSIPTNGEGDILLDFAGPAGTFLSVSYVDVLKRRVGPELFRGRSVLVGASAAGLMDLLSTPFGPGMPGVEVHANLLNQLQEGRVLRRAGPVADLSAAWVLALLSAAAVLLLGPLAAFGLAGGFAAAYSLLAMEVLVEQGVWISLTLPWFAWTLSLLMAAGYRYWTEARGRLAIKSAFGMYLAPEVVETIAQDPKGVELGGEERVITVGFSDIRGFTTAAEGLSPRDLTTFLREFLSEVTERVLREEGMVDKYIGDAVMMIFGAPNDLEDHPARACRAALAIREAIRHGEDRWTRLGLPGLRIGVGLNTGPAVVGNLGSSFRFEYTALGDTVNLASRLEGLNKALATEILVGEGTRIAAGSGFVFREMGLVRVKGKRKAVAVFELLGMVGDRADSRSDLPALASCFGSALAAFRARDWLRAREGFQRCVAMRPGDGPALYYLDRLEELERATLPEGWDAILDMEGERWSSQEGA